MSIVAQPTNKEHPLIERLREYVDGDWRNVCGAEEAAVNGIRAMGGIVRARSMNAGCFRIAFDLNEQQYLAAHFAYTWDGSLNHVTLKNVYSGVIG